ncbi:MAG: carboxypeptidase-like regulatory domain-containing protein, partial [candidate division KSB1 bacterium]|nr:carboxypeptidase-like regulatory domain-containing protein [candidate division KSB1 bacterium]
MKTKFFSCLLAALLVIFFPAWVTAGTKGKITGRVTEKETGEPLPGAKAVLEGPTVGAITATEGHYFIP